jgi:UDP-N-acetylglucosamine 3-dehydrogenase
MALEICVVGYGLMGRTHTEMYVNNPSVRRITVIDPFLNLPKNESAKKAFGKEVVFRERVGSKDIFDAISICVPSGYHLRVFEEYKTKAGAFLIEKPPALSLAEAKKMQEIGNSHGLIVGCAFVERFNPLIEEFKSRVAGKQERGHYYFKRIAPLPTPQSWYYDEKISGGPLLDLGVHDFDLVNVIIGEKIESISSDKKGNVVRCKLMFESGSSAGITSGWYNGLDFINEISFKGKSFNMEITGAELEKWRYPYSYQREIDEFISLILGKQVGFPLIDDGINALRIIDSVK